MQVIKVRARSLNHAVTSPVNLCPHCLLQLPPVRYMACLATTITLRTRCADVCTFTVVTTHTEPSLTLISTKASSSALHLRNLPAARRPSLHHYCVTEPNMNTHSETARTHVSPSDQFVRWEEMRA